MTTPQETQEELQNSAENQEETQEEIDWKARYEEAEARAEAAERRAESTKAGYPGALKQSARDELLTGLRGEVEDLKGLVVDALVNGDTEAARTRYETRQTENAEQEWADYHNERLADLMERLKGEDGSPVLDPQTDPELEEVRQRWSQAKEQRDRAGIERALSDAKDVIYARKFRGGNGQGSNGNQNGNKGEQNNPDNSTNPSSGANDQGEEDFLASMDTGPTSGGRGSYGSWDRVNEAFILGQIDVTRYDELRRQFGK